MGVREYEEDVTLKERWTGIGDHLSSPSNEGVDWEDLTSVLNLSNRKMLTEKWARHDGEFEVSFPSVRPRRSEQKWGLGTYISSLILVVLGMYQVCKGMCVEWEEQSVGPELWEVSTLKKMGEKRDSKKKRKRSWEEARHYGITESGLPLEDCALHLTLHASVWHLSYFTPLPGLYACFTS